MEIVLDRNLYRTIKQMDRTAMQSFLQDIYQSGINEATENGAAPAAAEAAPAETAAPAANSSVDLEALRGELSKVKGVGEARLNEIMKVIEGFMA
ncbi:MAG: hypothetical protein II916_05670 [Oscillospiraceae bacterium]|nr:hypothetical protein [Oscillospiraceae bacterium]